MVSRDDTGSYYGTVSGAPTVDLVSENADGPLYDGSYFGSSAYKIPVIEYSPEEIFANKVPVLNANFINPNTSSTGSSTMVALRDVVAGWYVAIRMISIIGLLSVLVYLTIRMMLSGIAADKAKYKKMLMSWVTAMCILFFLHYLMAFIMSISETITSMLSSNGSSTINVNVGGGETTFSTNLIGLVRFQIQHVSTMTKVAYLVIYIMMVVYTVKFTWVYLKRMIVMAFLTLIAPLIALTYPIDKVGDGQAQGFNMWLKEYLYNALLQPLHCLIYVVFASATIQIAKDNVLVAIIIFPLMGYAEKLLKAILGFNKANGGTMPSMLGAASAHAIGTMAGNMLKRGKAGRGGPGANKPRMKDSPDYTRGVPDNLDETEDAGSLRFSDDELDTNTYDSSEEGGLPSPRNSVGGNAGSEEEQETDENGIPLDQQQEYTDYLNDIIGDENASDEDKEFAQQQLDDYYQDNPDAQNAQVPEDEEEEQDEYEQYLQGILDNSDPNSRKYQKAQDDLAKYRQAQAYRKQWAQGNTESATLAEEIAKDKQRRFADKVEKQRRKAIRRQTPIGDRIANKVGEIPGAIDKAGLAAYKGVKRNLRGAMSAAKPLAYKAAKGAASTALRATIAAPMAAAAYGIAAATSDGNIGKAAQIAGTVGAAAFYGSGKVGKAVAGQAIEDAEYKAGLSTDYKSAFERGKYGSELNARKEREEKEFERSDALHQYLQEYYKDKSADERKEAMQAITTYHKYGIKDIKQADKLYKAEGKIKARMDEIGGKATRAEIASAAKAEARADSRTWVDDKAYKKVQESYVGRMSGSAEEKQRKAAKKMAIAKIVHDNK